MVTCGCTVSAAILTSIIAHAAHEKKLQGIAGIIPYWRVLKKDGELNLKYPGGIENLAHRLEAEGHAVVQKGKRFFVEQFR